MASSIQVLFLFALARHEPGAFGALPAGLSVFQPFFSVVGRCGATRVRSDSSRNDLRLRSLDGVFSSPCCKTGTFCARGQRAIASADGQASKLRPPQCPGSPEHEFSRKIKAKRPVGAPTEKNKIGTKRYLLLNALEGAASTLPHPVSSSHIRSIAETILRSASEGERDPSNLQIMALLELQISPRRYRMLPLHLWPLRLSRPVASIANFNKLDVPLVSADFFADASFFGCRLGLFNQAVRAVLNFIAKRLHNFVARLFAFERVSVDPYLQLVFACVVLVFYFCLL